VRVAKYFYHPTSDQRNESESVCGQSKTRSNLEYADLLLHLQDLLVYILVYYLYKLITMTRRHDQPCSTCTCTTVHLDLDNAMA